MLIEVEIRRAGVDTGSGRQRVRRACMEVLEKGEYPTIGTLKGMVPGVSDATIKAARWGLMQELAVREERRVVLDPSRLAQV